MLWSTVGRSSHGDDDLAPRAAGLDRGEGVAGGCERERLVDHRADRAGVDQRGELGELGAVGADVQEPVADLAPAGPQQRPVR